MFNILIFMKINRLMIITGGTGGHIFPGLVIANYFKKKKCKVKWIGSINRLEYILVPKNKINIDFIDIPNFFNYNIIFNIFKFLKIIYLICKNVNNWKPDLVLGFGGYISFLGIFSSWLCNIPTMIHEQNTVLGFSNKILYYISNKAVQAFPNTFNKNVSTVGNPIRDNILSISSPFKRLYKRNGPIRVLILGGSQGSFIINNIILKVIKLLNYKKFFFIHQIGINNYNYHKNDINYILKNKNYKFINFINNIYKYYNWADLVISRSGALTVSEISSIGLASIFIPFVHKDNHQYWNAKFLQKFNAAIIIKEKNLKVEYLHDVILSLNRKKLFYMSNKAYINRIKNPNKKFINEIYKI